MQATLSALLEAARQYPALAPRDAAKLCYQATHGAEHLLTDVAAARQAFDAEFAAVQPREGQLVEQISDAFARVHLGIWKQRGLPPEELFTLFLQTAQEPHPAAKAQHQALLSEVGSLAQAGQLPFDAMAWQAFIKDYKSAGLGPLHHSEAYRAQAIPSYRLVALRLISQTLR